MQTMSTALAPLMIIRRVVYSQEAARMLPLACLFDEQLLRSRVRPAWLRLYDRPWVDALIEQLLSWRPQTGTLMERLRMCVYAPCAGGSGGNGDPAEVCVLTCVRVSLLLAMGHWGRVEMPCVWVQTMTAASCV
jgi:hypothetical protein